MNAQGVTVEAAYGRPVLSGFHAAWSIGTFVGAVIGGFGAGLHVPIAAQQAGVGVRPRGRRPDHRALVHS